MSEPSTNADPRRRPSGLRGHAAGLIALAALAVAAAAWFWTTRQPPRLDAGFGLPHGVMVAGACAFIAALIAQIRAMSLGEILEAAWDLFVGLLGLVGAVFKGILNWFLGLLGWD